jgi:hypothetical protein
VEKSASPPKLPLATHSIAFTAAAIIFRIFSPKITCQAPKPPNQFKQNKLGLAC